MTVIPDKSGTIHLSSQFQRETETESGSQLPSMESDSVKLPNIWALEQSKKREDVDRFRYFMQLVTQFTEDITDKLEDRQRRNPEIYNGRKRLFQFSLDQETEANREWMMFNFPIIQNQFKTRNFVSVKKTVHMVTNIMRHVVRWINEHYDLEQPIFYENKDVYVETDRNTGKKIYKYYSFISF